MRSSIACSPPKRWVTPVTSNKRYRGPSNATNGVKRSHQSATLVSSFKSACSSAVTTLSLGNMARALASGCPTASPCDVALRSTAERRSALFTFEISTKGGVSAFETLCICSRRCNRSVGSRGNHSAIIRLRGLEDTVITIPLHKPMSGFPMPVTNEAHLKTWIAPVFVSC